VLDALTRSRATKLPYDGVGFAFLPDDGLIGVDLDHMLDESTGELNARALAIIKACDSYTEWSPSKKGLHIIVRGTTKTNKSDKVGVEIFCGSQYFTFTGEHYSGTPTEVTEISPKALARLHATVDEAKGRRKPALAPARAPAGGAGDARPPGAKAGVSELSNDFKAVNDAAMRNFDAWVPALFPSAKRTGRGYRVASASLGRDLEEDLSFHEEGIKDYGVHDLGDVREGKRTPIDVVIEWSAAKRPAEALHWLAGQLGMTLAKPQGRGRRGGGGGEAPPGGGDPDDGRPRRAFR
jgi:hypothetical protein